MSNTFTQRWEMQPYLDMATKYGALVDMATNLIDIATGNYQSTHGVPDEVIERMRRRWED